MTSVLSPNLLYTEGMDKATFAAGCFWGVEAQFRSVPGVRDARVGYIGGALPEPTYKDVCSGRTGHAEAVQVEFDPAIVSYSQLLDQFFQLHDPTTLNRQGPDHGTQYRSAIFYHSAEQRAAAEAAKEKWNHSERFRHPVVTQIAEAGTFWDAEDYHQRYLEKRGQTHCAF